MQVRVNSGTLSEENCHIYKTTGSAMSVSLPAVPGSSGSSNNSPSDNNDNNKDNHDSSTTNNDRMKKVTVITIISAPTIQMIMVAVVATYCTGRIEKGNLVVIVDLTYIEGIVIKDLVVVAMVIRDLTAITMVTTVTQLIILEFPSYWTYPIACDCSLILILVSNYLLSNITSNRIGVEIVSS